MFIDGLRDTISRSKVAVIFAKAGTLRDVYEQQRRKVGRRFKVVFVRYATYKEAWRDIRQFNGIRLEGAYLDVKKAKYQEGAKKRRTTGWEHDQRINYGSEDVYGSKRVYNHIQRRERFLAVKELRPRG